jgi:hypothetical protein
MKTVSIVLSISALLVVVGCQKTILKPAATVVAPAQETNVNRTAIVYGVDKSSVVVSGISRGSAGGGGGVTTRLKVEKVFLGNDSLKGKFITVFWSDGKANEQGKHIWFLKPHARGGYTETVGTKHPFVEATADNVRLLQSYIKERQ